VTTEGPTPLPSVSAPLPPGFALPAPGAPGFDPHAVPVHHAATVVVLDDRAGPDGRLGLEVLLLRRRKGSAFVGGMTVFPGGGLDPDDAEPRYLTRAPGLTDAAASVRLGLEVGGLAYWIAVVRETFEETGVLLAHGRDGGPVPAAALAERHAVDRGERRLLEVLDEHDLVVDTAAIAAFARWVTPVGPPRRYDTYFFVTSMPPDQIATVDNVEAVHGEWRTPAAGLEGFASGQLVMLPPTVAMLQLLARFDTTAACLAELARWEAPGLPARLFSVPGSFRVVVPGDPGYADVDGKDATGWIHMPPSYATTAAEEDHS
jgi:8-oxo-dGTP pyrophosphatase MutT (NUDIX family)